MASASGERLMIARGIDAGWPRRPAARCSRARSAASGRAKLCRLSRHHLNVSLEFLWGECRLEVIAHRFQASIEQWKRPALTSAIPTKATLMTVSMYAERKICRIER